MTNPVRPLDPRPTRAPGTGTEPPAQEAASGGLSDGVLGLAEPARPLWSGVAEYPLVAALVIVALSYGLAFLIRTPLLNALGRLASGTETTLDDRVIAALRRPVFNVVFLFGLTLAARTAALPRGTDIVVGVLLSLIVVIVMRAAFFLCGELLDAFARNRHRFAIVEARTLPLFDIVGRLLIILLGSYALLMIWGVNPVGWLASAGIVGIAVGFAAQDTLANLFSGLFILIDTPYKVGDYVNLDSGERGRVTQIGMRSTRLQTRDDVEIIVPNSVMGNAKIVNESGGTAEKMRLRIGVGAAYGSDAHRVVEVLESVAAEHAEICAAPAPRVRMRGFGESSLDFELLGWIERPEDRGRISHELYLAVYDAFAAADIEIPYAKRDVYVRGMPAEE